LKIDISKDVFESTATVIKVEDQRYSTTHVTPGHTTTTYGAYGAAHTTTTPATSTVSHHQNQKIWFVDEAGNEGSRSFYNQDIDVREGNTIRMVFSKKTGEILRLKNETTGYYWRLKGYGLSSSAAGRLWNGITNRIGALFYTVFFNLPGINALLGLGMIFGGHGASFHYEKRKTRIHRLIFIGLVVLMGLSLYLAYGDVPRDKLPSWKVSLSADAQASIAQTAAKSYSWYLNTGAPLGVLEDLTVEQAKEQAEEIISLSHSELITKENLKNETLDMFKPTDENTFVVYYVFLTFIGLFVLYFYRRKVQNIEDQVNRRLDGMC